MICLNELGECNKREILEPLAILLSPFAPHITEELWQTALGHTETIFDARFPAYDEQHLVENSFEYPISFNGKVRFKKELPLGVPNEELEKQILADSTTARYLDGKTPRKVIVVPGKIINIVM